MRGLAEESGELSLLSILITSGKEARESSRSGDECVVSVEPTGTSAIAPVFEKFLKTRAREYGCDVTTGSGRAGGGGGSRSISSALALAAGSTKPLRLVSHIAAPKLLRPTRPRAVLS